MPTSNRRRGPIAAVVPACVAVLLAAGVAAGAEKPLDPAVAREPADTAYRIGVDDTLEVIVWKEDISRPGLMVRPDGRVSIPVAGDIMAAGSTPSELAREIEQRLKTYYKDPHVTVMVTAINSYRVYVLGQVAKPGLLNFKSPTRLMEAIVSAGGFGPFADESHVRVFTQGPGEGAGQRMVEIDTKKIMNGNRLEDNLFLKPGDMIYVP
jgi:polysaccharide export outer membrane protein